MLGHFSTQTLMTLNILKKNSKMLHQWTSYNYDESCFQLLNNVLNNWKVKVRNNFIYYYRSIYIGYILCEYGLNVILDSERIDFSNWAYSEVIWARTYLWYGVNIKSFLNIQCTPYVFITRSCSWLLIVSQIIIILYVMRESRVNKI